MPHALEQETYAKITRLLLQQQRPKAIAEQVPASLSVIYKVQSNLQAYGSARAPRSKLVGCPPKITADAGKKLLEYVTDRPWAHQDELARFLWEDCNVWCERSTVSRFLTRAGRTRNEAIRVARVQNHILRQAWEAEMADKRADQLVFLDEGLFNQMSGGRKRAYGPIGSASRYLEDPRKGITWSFLPAYTTSGYLPCTAIREGYFNDDDFYEYITQSLLPLCNAWPAEKSVIIMDNRSRDGEHRIIQAINNAGCKVLFIPPYSPDLNPNELTFSVLEAWLKRHYRSMWPSFDGAYGTFLDRAIQHSACDRFVLEHFRFGASGYTFDGEIEAFHIQLDSLLLTREASAA